MGLARHQEPVGCCGLGVVGCFDFTLGRGGGWGEGAVTYVHAVRPTVV